MNKWRPDNWDSKAIVDGVLTSGELTTGMMASQELVEAGADAILEVLKQKPDTQYGELDSDLHANDYCLEIYTIGEEKFGERIMEQEDNVKGWLVFIKDE